MEGTDDGVEVSAVEVETPIRTPLDLMTRLTKKDPGLRYKEEQEGKVVNYLDLRIEISEEKLKVNIFRKPTHVWDLPGWKSRGPVQHKKAAILPLLIRAYRLLKDIGVRREEVKNVFGHAISKGYSIKVMRRWNKEAEEVARRPKEKRRITWFIGIYLQRGWTGILGKY